MDAVRLLPAHEASRAQVREAWQGPGDGPPARREQIRHYIESHLRDPQLAPAGVAAALHISTRYLHQVFNADGETVARYILRRRVEECAHALQDQAQAASSVTDIAFRHGFNDASHFGRVFRAYYGTTPRGYRRLRQPEAAGAVRALRAAAGPARIDDPQAGPHPLGRTQNG
ncbi:MAG TPA: helix-turn-helix domain-containing protein [Steroidobacteraceae bacterium]|nr:helix-turn-helix domain-containing protein [Steroidobacteraceae bacterium]